MFVFVQFELGCLWTGAFTLWAVCRWGITTRRAAVLIPYLMLCLLCGEIFRQQDGYVNTSTTATIFHCVQRGYKGPYYNCTCSCVRRDVLSVSHCIRLPRLPCPCLLGLVNSETELFQQLPHLHPRSSFYALQEKLRSISWSWQVKQHLVRSSYRVHVGKCCMKRTLLQNIPVYNETQRAFLMLTPPIQHDTLNGQWT